MNLPLHFFVKIQWSFPKKQPISFMREIYGCAHHELLTKIETPPVDFAVPSRRGATA